MRKITKRSAAIIAATAIAVGGGATAWAAGWFSGTGSATASATKAQAVTATATVAASDKLWPGKSRNATVTISNPNDYPVRVTDTLTPVVTVTGGGSECTGASSKVTLGNVPNNVVIQGRTATGPTVATGVWADFIKMGADANIACSEATFTINFTLDGAIA